MTIDKVIDFVNDLLAKEQMGYHTPDEIIAALNAGQIRVYNHYLPLYGANREAKEALAPFVKKLSFATDGAGIYVVPSINEFQGLTSLGIVFSESGALRNFAVPIPAEDEFDNKLNSQLNKVTVTNPIAEVTGLGAFNFTPQPCMPGRYDFSGSPKEAKYVATQAGRTFTYNSSTSVQLEWATKYQYKVIMAGLTYLGINMGDDRTIQISESLSKLNS